MIVVDHSILKSVATCELQAWLRHVGGWTAAEMDAPLQAGIAAHAALANYFIGRVPARALSIFEAAYRAWAEAHTADHLVLSWPNTRDVMRHWFERVGPTLDWEVLSVEERLERELAPGVLYRGRLDVRIHETLTSNEAVVDHKTTQRLGQTWADAWQLDAQMTGYAWLLTPQATPQVTPQAARFYINGIEWSRLPTSTKQCKTHGTPFNACRLAHAGWHVVGPYHRTPQQIETWQRTVLILARRLDALMQRELVAVNPTGELTGACVRCQFHDWCKLGRHADQLERMFVVERWTPGGPE